MSIFNNFPNTAAILQLLGDSGLNGLLGGQQTTVHQQANTNPLAVLLGLQQQSTPATTGGLDTILSQYLNLGETLPTSTPVTETITLLTFDVNFIRQLGDDASLGGNGDGKLRKAELTKATELLTNLSSLFGNQANATFKTILKTATLLSNNDIAKQISGKDGNNSDISGQDIVLAAQGDADKKLETIQVNKPVAAKPKADTNNILELLIKQLLGL